MAKNKWSVTLENKDLKFSYGDQSQVRLTNEGEVVDGFDTNEPINAIEHLYDIPNRADAKTTAKLLLQSQGDELFRFVTTAELDMQLDELIDIDFTDDGIDMILVSNGDGTYKWGQQLITKTVDIDQNTVGNAGFVLTDNGAGVFEFQIPELKKLTDIDFTAQDVGLLNDPLTVEGLVFTTQGDGTFDFRIPTVHVNDLLGVNWGTPDPLTTPGLVLTSRGDGTYDFLTPSAQFTDLLGIDWATADPLTQPGTVLTALGDGTFYWRIPSANFNDLTNIDFVTNDPNNISDLQLTTTGTYDVDGSPIYEWRYPHFTNLLDIDFTTPGANITNDLVLTSVGDGTYTWTEPVREFEDLTNIDWTNAFTTPNLVLTSDGSGSFSWQVAQGLFEDLTNVTGTIVPGQILVSTAPNTYGFMEPVDTVLELLDVVQTPSNDPVNTAGLVLTSQGGSQFEFNPIEIGFDQITGFDITNDAAGAVLTSLGGGNYEWAQPTITDLIDINTSNSTTPNTFLTSDNAGNYYFDVVSFNNFLEIDYSNNTTAGNVLIADGDGTYSYHTPLLVDLADIDFTTTPQLPLSTSGMYLTSVGDGTFNFTMPNLDLFTDIDFTNDIAGNILTANGDGTYEFTTRKLVTLSDVTVGVSETQGNLFLKSVGDGTYDFVPINIELANLTDIDFLAPVDAATTTNAVLYAEGDGTFAWHEPMLAYLIDVDDTTNSPLTTDSLVLTSVGDGTYNFQVPTVYLENVLNLDTTINDPMNTQGWSLVSDGDGTFSFQIPNISQDYINELDTTINSPIDTADLYLQSNGDGTYSYNPLELNHASDIDWSAAPYPDRWVLVSDGDGTFTWRDPLTTFDQYIDSMLDLDHDSALATIGGAFLDGSVMTTVAGRTDGIKYEWRPASDFQIRFDNLIDVDTTQVTPIQPFRTPVKADTTIPTFDVSSTSTQGLIMISDGDASYSFIYPELRLMCDVDLTPQDTGLLNDPLTTQGLLMHTTGTGDYVFSNQLTAIQIEDILIGIDAPNEISTATMDLVLDSATGITTVDDILEVTSLTPTRVVFVGTDSALVDDATFTFDSTTTALTVDDVTIDANTISTPAGVELVLDPDADAAGAGVVRIQGDLHVMGTTSTINSTTVTIDDPVFTMGGDTIPTLDDGLDRGIEFNWHDGVDPKVGFFGWDRSAERFTFIRDAVNGGEIFSGTAGDVAFSEVFATGGTFGDIQIAVTDDNTIDTLTNDLHISSATLDVTVTGNIIPTVGADGLGAGFDLGYRDPLEVDPPILWKDIHSESIQLEDTGYLRTEPIATEPFAIVMAIALG
jgi:hypothetical protein